MSRPRAAMRDGYGYAVAQVWIGILAERRFGA
jgi:hypothetical protein